MCMREQPCRSRRTHDALPHLQHPMHAAAIGGRSLLVCTMVFGRMWLGGALRGVCSVRLQAAWRRGETSAGPAWPRREASDDRGAHLLIRPFEGMCQPALST